MTTELLIGGYNARTAFGFVVSRVTGLHDAPSTALALQPVPGRAGALRLQDRQVEVRQLVIAGVVRGETPAAARLYRDRMLAVLSRSELRLSTADDLTREIRAELTGVSSSPIGAQFLARDIRLEITATAIEPFWRDTTATSIGGIGTSPVACPLGSAPVAPVLTITGAGSVVHVTLRSALGAIVTRMQLAGLVPGVAVVIDCEAQTIRQGEQSQIQTLLAGDFPVLDAAADGDPVAEAWPTLSCSQGVMTATYARRWA